MATTHRRRSRTALTEGNVEEAIVFLRGHNVATIIAEDEDLLWDVAWCLWVLENPGLETVTPTDLHRAVAQLRERAVFRRSLRQIQPFRKADRLRHGLVNQRLKRVASQRAQHFPARLPARPDVTPRKA